MKAATGQVRKKRGAVAGTFFAWLQDCGGPDELRALRRQVPAPVLFILPRLKGGDYRRRVMQAWR